MFCCQARSSYAKTSFGGAVAKERYQAVGFAYNRMLMLSSSGGIRIDVLVLSVLWSVVDHSVILQTLKKGLIEHEASDTGGVPRCKSSCPDRLAEATTPRHTAGITCTGHFDKFVATSIPVSDTSVSSVRHRYVRYDINTGSGLFGEFGTTSIPVPDTLLASVRFQYR